MATMTLGALRLIIAQELGLVGSGTATSATASTLVDITTPARRGERNDYWNGGIAKLVSGTGSTGYPERYISDWVQSTQTATIAPNWDTTPDNTTGYELYKKTFTPDDYKWAINAAIEKSWPHIFDKDEDTSLTTVANTYAYTIPSTVNPDWTYTVEIQDVTSPTSYPYIRVPFQLIRDDAGTAYVQFLFLPQTDRTIRIRSVKRLSTLSTEMSTIDIIYSDYIKARAKALLYMKLLGAPMRSDREQVMENVVAFERQAQVALRACSRQMPNTYIRPQLLPSHTA